LIECVLSFELWHVMAKCQYLLAQKNNKWQHKKLHEMCEGWLETLTKYNVVVLHGWKEETSDIILKWSWTSMCYGKMLRFNDNKQ
jgi:hypothetical protein